MASQSEERKDDFEKRMKDTVLAGHTLAGIALGQKLNLFSFFDEKPLTALELAEKANCKERYVQEWLRHMVLCDVIEADDTGTKFTLPQHRRQVLTDKSTLVGDPLTLIFPYVLIPHKQLVECFRSDGPNGLPFDAVRASLDEYLEPTVEEHITTADYIVEHVRGLKEKLENGINVCEVGIGNGTVLFHLAKKYPKSTFLGFDMSQAMLAKAEAKWKDNGSPGNVTFRNEDATDLPEDMNDKFHFLYMRKVLHDISHASKALENIYRCMKPGGYVSFTEYNMKENISEARQDPSLKMNGQIMFIGSLYHCLPASMHTPGSQGLGTLPGNQYLLRLIEKAGFNVDETDLSVFGNMMVQLVGKKHESVN